MLTGDEEQGRVQHVPCWGACSQQHPEHVPPSVETPLKPCQSTSQILLPSPAQKLLTESHCSTALQGCAPRGFHVAPGCLLMQHTVSAAHQQRICPCTLVNSLSL